MKLPTDHPYHCSAQNYYSNEPYQEFETLYDFLEEFGDADVDMNLVFRWDVNKYDEESERDGFYLEIFMILQRKGIFCSKRIQDFKKSDVPDLEKFLKPHWDKLKEMWVPLSNKEE